MTVAIDNSVLTLILNANAKARANPATGEPAPYVQDRISGLLEEMSNKGETLVVPAPALAESMCYASPPNVIIDRISSFACVEIGGFDQKSALEFAELIQRHRPGVRKIKADANLQWQFIKMDLQIVSIAKAYGATKIITDDGPQGNFASLAGLHVVRTWDLPLLDKYKQGGLFDGG